LQLIFLLSYIPYVECPVFFTDEFEAWWDGLSMEEQDSIDPVVLMLGQEGATLRFPYSSGIKGSRYSQLRELRIQHQGRPYRIFVCVRP
jgi:hypothetical protein